MTVKTLLLLSLAGAGVALHTPRAEAASYQSLHSFSGNPGNGTFPDGATPTSGLFVVKGGVFGTTASGGFDYDGSVYSFDPKHGKVLVLSSFSTLHNGVGWQPGPTPLAIQGTDGYGALTSNYTNGGIYKVSLVNGAVTPLFNFPSVQQGAFPQGVIYAEGALYGVCEGGGLLANGTVNGTVFEVNPVTGRDITLHVFSGGADGGVPLAGLIYANGMLYGTASVGGTANAGVVFAISPVTGAETVVYNFAGGTDGSGPTSLIMSGGLLYGTTSGGGAANAGTVFSIDPSTGAETQIYAFAGGADGAAPTAPLLPQTGYLYGTSSAGGTNGKGTLFRIATASGTKTTLHNFGAKTDGATPAGALISLDGTIYGTTEAGGSENDGTIFGYTP